ncbi:hypothetical protein TcCL_NonESM12016 [Trypanosoma cruzi]|nr:hypothetical protein TcCL_NonESM12016 [Trypanosoma cruzi]
MERNFGWCVVDYLQVIQRGNAICGENEWHLRAACFVSARWSGSAQRPERPGAKRPALLQAEGCTLLFLALLWSPEVPAGNLFPPPHYFVDWCLPRPFEAGRGMDRESVCRVAVL